MANRQINSYKHKDKDRLNNPPVGLVTPKTDPEEGSKQYIHDPYIDPQLSWAGKAEHTKFEVPTVSLHVHERIDPRTIIEAVRKHSDIEQQTPLFDLGFPPPPSGGN
ncbi:MAG: hypothetical protein OXC02_08230 [Rhodobacteraceae bacterium]|nr:hypothetical protein [Paracoccaceae bacterium]